MLVLIESASVSEKAHLKMLNPGQPLSATQERIAEQWRETSHRRLGDFLRSNSEETDATFDATLYTVELLGI